MKIKRTFSAKSWLRGKLQIVDSHILTYLIEMCIQKFLSTMPKVPIECRLELFIQEVDEDTANKGLTSAPKTSRRTVYNLIRRRFITSPIIYVCSRWYITQRFDSVASSSNIPEHRRVIVITEITKMNCTWMVYFIHRWKIMLSYI